MEKQKQSSVGSQYMASDLGITRRTANYIKNQEGFPRFHLGVITNSYCLTIF